MTEPKKQRNPVPTPKKISANNKQGYKWRLVIEGPPDPVTGERTQIPRVRDTIGEVKAACKEEYDRLTAGIHSKQAKNATFEDAAWGWFEDYKLTGVAESTIDQRIVTIHSILKHLSKAKLEKITHTHFQQILNKLFLEGKSQSYMKTFRSVSKLIFEWAIINNLCRENPVSRTKIPKRQRTVEEIESSSVEDLYLEHNEINEYLNAVLKYGKYTDKEAFFLLVYSGLRPGETVGLRYNDINHDTNYIRVSKTLYTPKNNMYKAKVKAPKTKKSERTFPLEPMIVDMIEKHIAVAKERQRRYQAQHDDYYDGQFIFARDNGRPYSGTTLINRMKRLLKKTSITKEATPHIFRHTHISLLTEAGVDLPTIMQRVGHEDAKTTLRIYTHITKKMQKDGADKVSVHFNNIINPHLLQVL